jgi:hypothetical protein
MDVPISNDAMIIEKWVKTLPPDIKVSLSENTKTAAIYYKPKETHDITFKISYNDEKFMIIGSPPAHVYLRAAWYGNNGYNRILVTPW